MNREIYLKNIADSLALLSTQVSIRNAINLYDINIISEDFYPGLLNIIFDKKLINANNVEKNAPGIDLIDEENKLAIQVTSDNTSEKIKHTINEFIDKASYLKYDHLLILILTNKRKYKMEFDTKELFPFSKENILDIKDLITKIRALSVKKLKDINDFLNLELNEKYEKSVSTEADEVGTIIDLIEFISSNKKIRKLRDTVVDPEYKINYRFREFADLIKTQYVQLLTIYGNALAEIEKINGMDEAQDIITKMYLQDISIEYLDKANNDPMRALSLLVDFFEMKLSSNGKKYNKMAIKFFLIDSLIKCNVFPNERSEYDDSKC